MSLNEKWNLKKNVSEHDAYCEWKTSKYTLKTHLTKSIILKFFDDEKIQASVIYSFIAMRINWKRSINPKGVHVTKEKMRKKNIYWIILINQIDLLNKIMKSSECREFK